MGRKRKREPLPEESKSFMYRLFSSKPFLALFLSMMILIGSWAIFQGVRGVWFAYKSSDWPSTAGIIQKSFVDSEHVSRKPRVKIFYEYTVDRKSFIGERVAYESLRYSIPGAHKIVARYPAEKQVAVYYNPDDPEECVLEPGLEIQAFIPAVVGIVFLLGSGVGVYLVFFSKNVFEKG